MNLTPPPHPSQNSHAVNQCIVPLNQNGESLISLSSPDWSASLRPSFERKTRPDALLLLLLPAGAEGVCAGPEARVHDGDGVLGGHQPRRDSRRPRRHAVQLGVVGQRRQQRRPDLGLDVLSVGVTVVVVVVVSFVGRLAHRVPPRRSTLPRTPQLSSSTTSLDPAPYTTAVNFELCEIYYRRLALYELYYTKGYSDVIS